MFGNHISVFEGVGESCLNIVLEDVDYEIIRAFLDWSHMI